MHRAPIPRRCKYRAFVTVEKKQDADQDHPQSGIKISILYLRNRSLGWRYGGTNLVV
jgi:hypothetical protein